MHSTNYLQKYTMNPLPPLLQVLTSRALILILAASFFLLLFVLPEVSAYQPCSICGDHHAVADLDGLFDGLVPYNNDRHRCGITEDLGRQGLLEQCEGGQGRFYKIDFGTFLSDDDGAYWFNCKCVRTDTDDDPCHVCGPNRIVSRPLDTIDTLPENPPSDQYQYLNKYSCQSLQDGDGFDDNCFDHLGSNRGSMEYSPEMVAIFEENCGCEERTECHLCPVGQALQFVVSTP